VATEQLDIIVDDSQIEGLSAAFGRLSNAMRATQATGERNTRSLAAQGSEASKTDRAASQLRRAYDNLRSATDRLAKAGQGMGASLGRAGANIARIGAAAGAAVAVAGLALAAKGAQVAFRELSEAVKEGIERNEEAAATVGALREQYAGYMSGLADGIVSSEGFARAVAALSGLMNGLVSVFGSAESTGKSLGDFIGRTFVTVLQITVDLVAGAVAAFQGLQGGFDAAKIAARGVAQVFRGVFFAAINAVQQVAAGLAVTFAGLAEQAAGIAAAAPGMGTLATSLRGVATSARSTANNLEAAAAASDQIVNESFASAGSSFSDMRDSIAQTAAQMQATSDRADEINNAIRSAAEGASAFSSATAEANRTITSTAAAAEVLKEATKESALVARDALEIERQKLALLEEQTAAMREQDLLADKAVQLGIMEKELEEQKLSFQMSLANTQPVDVLDKAAISAGLARERMVELGRTMGSDVLTSIGDIGSAFGEAFGAKDFDSLLANSGKFLGQLLSDLGKAAIATGAVVTLGDPATGFLPNPARGLGLILAGTAAVVAGSALGAASAGSGGGGGGGSSSRPAQEAGGSAAASSSTVNVSNTFGIVGDPRATARMIGDQVRSGGRTGAVRPV